MANKRYEYNRQVISLRFNLGNPEDLELFHAVQIYMKEHGLKQSEFIRQAVKSLLGQRTILLDQEALNEAVRKALGGQKHGQNVAGWWNSLEL